MDYHNYVLTSIIKSFCKHKAYRDYTTMHTCVMYMRMFFSFNRFIHSHICTVTSIYRLMSDLWDILNNNNSCPLPYITLLHGSKY